MIRVGAESVNGRRIFGLGPGGCLGWFVEMRGPDYGDTYLQVWSKFETLEDAQAEARRLGLLPSSQETQTTNQTASERKSFVEGYIAGWRSILGHLATPMSIPIYELLPDKSPYQQGYEQGRAFAGGR